MPSKRRTWQVVTALVLAGAVCVALRFQARRDVRLGYGDTVWRLIYSIECEAERPGARLRVAIPADAPCARVFREDMRHSNLRISPLRSTRVQSRERVAFALDGDECELTLRFDLHLRPAGDFPIDAGPAAPAAEERAKYLESTADIPTRLEAVGQVLAELEFEPGSRAEMVEAVFAFCHDEIVSGGEAAPDDVETVLADGYASPLGHARTMVALCRASRIPARLVTGFAMEESRHARPHHWVEVLTNDHWLPYDPANGFARQLPHTFVPVRRGGEAIVVGEGLEELEPRFSIVRLPGGPPGLTAGSRNPLRILDLTRLPIEMQRVLKVILLMPLGALVTCVFRNLIGIRTSGTFTPTLLALAFVFADWRTGLIVLAAVILLGVATRSFLERLKLLMLPRLSIVLTLVVCLIVFGVSALDYFDWTPGAETVLLPMVILTMIVERFYVTSQEDGPDVALQLLGGTVVLGVFCYLVLRWEAVAQLFLTYPEAHFFTVAVLILIGRYTGYQLLELWRFRDVDTKAP